MSNTQAAPSGTQGRSLRSGDSPLVGREAEIAALEGGEGERAPGAPAPVVVLHGEPGIGKTSLVARFAERAVIRGSTVLSGACLEESDPPYGPWVSAIRDYLDGVSHEHAVELLAPDGAVLASVVPGVRAVLGDLPAAAVLLPSEGRLRWFDAVTRFFERLEQPVLVLDDLQWADTSTLDLLVHVARLVAGLTLVVTCRGGKLELNDPLTLHLACVGRARPVTYLRLEGLPREDAEELLDREAGRKLEPALVDAVYAETGGNPFFLHELGHHLQRDRRVAGEGAHWELPESIRGALGLRLAALTERTRAMLELAAAFTGSFAFDELEALTGMGEVELLESLEEALGGELLRSLGRERYGFAHELIRHALYEGVSPSRRARLHRRVAKALEGLSEDRPGAVAAEIARQYHASLTLAGAERGVPYALTAAEHAREVHAPAEAAQLLRLALELVPGRDDALRAQVLGSLALAEAEAAMPGQAERTLESAITLLERGGADGRKIAELTCEVATAMWWASAHMARGAAVIERALGMLGEERSLLWARLKILRGHFAEPLGSGPIHFVPFVEPGLEAARIIRAQGTEWDIAGMIDPAGAWDEDDLERAVAEVARWSEPAARCAALFWLAYRVTLQQPGSPELAEKLCRELEILADQGGALLHRMAVAAYRSALHGARGSFDSAVEQLAVARSRLDRLPEASHRAFSLCLESLVAMHRDPEWPDLGDELWREATFAEDPGASPMCAALACYAFVRGGLAVKARRLLEGVLVPAIRAASPWDHMLAPTLAHAAAAIWDLDDEELARKLLPAAQAVVAAGVPDWYMSSNDLTLARLTTVLGRHEQAAAAFAAARERLEREGQVPIRAIVDYDEALARSRRGQPGSSELLVAAETQFEELGMTVWSERIVEIRRSRGGLPDGLTRREAEVLRLVASGLTGRQIAEELVLSVHTVERHLHNAYAKIGARNRAEASAYTARHGL